MRDLWVCGVASLNSVSFVRGVAVTSEELFMFTYNEESRDIGVHDHRPLFQDSFDSSVEKVGCDAAERVVIEASDKQDGSSTVCVVSARGRVSISRHSIYASRDRQTKPRGVLLEDLSLAADEWLYLRTDSEKEL